MSAGKTWRCTQSDAWVSLTYEGASNGTHCHWYSPDHRTREPFRALSACPRRRGHEVRWNTSATFREPIEATGVRFVPSEHARDFKEFRREDFVAGGEKLQGVAALKVDIKHGFIDNAPRQLRDLQTITRDFQPDVILGDPGFIGGLFYAELTGMPFAVLNVLPMASAAATRRRTALVCRRRIIAGSAAQPRPELGRRACNLSGCAAALEPRSRRSGVSAHRLVDGCREVGVTLHAALGAGVRVPRSDLPARMCISIGMLPAQAPHQLDTAGLVG